MRRPAAWFVGRTLASSVLILLVAFQPSACDGPDQEDLRWILPADLYAVPGVEMNVYFDNIILHPRSETLLCDVDCDLGTQQSERWSCVPAPEQVGDHTLAIRVVSAEMEILTEVETTVHVIDPQAGAGDAITMLCVGDSLTAASQYTRRLVELFPQEGNPQLTLIGESGPGGDTGNRHEGYGGWTCERFTTLWSEEDWAEIEGRKRRQRSPFVFEINGEPKLDFQQYLGKNSGGEPPDFITILLGCNDTFSATEETIEERIDAMFTNLDLLLDAFRAAGPDTQIALLLLVPPAATQDAFGRNYKCGQTRWQYRRNQHRVVEREMEEYGGAEEQDLFLIPAHVNLDTRHGFPSSATPPNVHATEELARLANGVHPATAGYYQIGDSIYCWLKGRLSQ